MFRASSLFLVARSAVQTFDSDHRRFNSIIGACPLVFFSFFLFLLSLNFCVKFASQQTDVTRFPSFTLSTNEEDRSNYIWCHEPGEQFLLQGNSCSRFEIVVPQVTNTQKETVTNWESLMEWRLSASMLTAVPLSTLSLSNGFNISISDLLISPGLMCARETHRKNMTKLSRKRDRSLHIRRRGKKKEDLFVHLFNPKRVLRVHFDRFASTLEDFISIRNKYILDFSTLCTLYFLHVIGHIFVRSNHPRTERNKSRGMIRKIQRFYQLIMFRLFNFETKPVFFHSPGSAALKTFLYHKRCATFRRCTSLDHVQLFHIKCVSFPSWGKILKLKSQ